MRISVEGKIGIGLALLSAIGTGAIMIWSHQTDIGWTIIAFSAFGLVLLLIHHFSAKESDLPVKPANSEPSVPEIGSFHFSKGIMEVGHSKSTGDIFVQIQAEIFNSNNFMIEFDGVLSGSANGIPSQPPKRIVSGHVAAKSSTFLTYDRIMGAKFNDTANFSAAVVAFLNYDLKYKKVGAKEWTRASAKALRFSQPFNYAPGPIGTVQTFQITVLIDASSEI